MKSMPNSTARRSTRTASARSAGWPQIPLPVIRIAPNPSRVTRRSFPIRNSPAFPASPLACGLDEMSFCMLYSPLLWKLVAEHHAWVIRTKPASSPAPILPGSYLTVGGMLLISRRGAVGASSSLDIRLRSWCLCAEGRHFVGACPTFVTQPPRSGDLKTVAVDCQFFERLSRANGMNGWTAESRRFIKRSGLIGLRPGNGFVPPATAALAVAMNRPHPRVVHEGAPQIGQPPRDSACTTQAASTCHSACTSQAACTPQGGRLRDLRRCRCESEIHTLF